MLQFATSGYAETALITTDRATNIGPTVKTAVHAVFA
jgi:hypothetical protein